MVLQNLLVLHEQQRFAQVKTGTSRSITMVKDHRSEHSRILACCWRDKW